MACSSLFVDAQLGRLCRLSLHEVSFTSACSTTPIRFGAHPQEAAAGEGAGRLLLHQAVTSRVREIRKLYEGSQFRRWWSRRDLRSKTQVWRPKLCYRDFFQLLQMALNDYMDLRLICVIYIWNVCMSINILGLNGYGVTWDCYWWMERSFLDNRRGLECIESYLDHRWSGNWEFPVLQYLLYGR